MRQQIKYQNKHWKRVEGGGYCDSCGNLIVGFLSAYLQKTTRRKLCQDCYLSGK